MLFEYEYNRIKKREKLLKPDSTTKQVGAQRSPKRIKSLCMADRMIRDIKTGARAGMRMAQNGGQTNGNI